MSVVGFQQFTGAGVGSVIRGLVEVKATAGTATGTGTAAGSGFASGWKQKSEPSETWAVQSEPSETWVVQSESAETWTGKDVA